MSFFKRFTFYLILLIFTVSYGEGSFADSKTGQKWNGHISLEARKGNQRNLGETRLFMPLRQNHNSMIFLDVRGFMDNQRTREGNFGLGYRKIHRNLFFGQDWILGGYGFFDLRHTSSGNKFIQGTFGAEALSEKWDARVNIYIPQSKEKDIDGTDDVQTSVVGTQLRLVGTNNIRERAMAGYDIELGYKLPIFDKYVDEVRAYGGGFHFAANGYDNVTGPRARFELRWNDLPHYGKGSRFSLGAEIQHDDVRQRTGFLIARLRIPFQTFKSKDSKYRHLSALERRMTDSIERDIDIVAGKEKAPRVVNEPATITVNGQEISNVVLLDANDNVPVEITNAGVGATIILDGKAGIINNGGASITPLDNQNILGAGIYVTGTGTGLSAPIGSRPTLSSNNVTDVFNISNVNNLTIRSINIDGSRQAFSIASSSGSTYDDITISNTLLDAINLSLSNNNIITNIYANNVGNNGLILGNSSNNTITNVTVKDSNSTGFTLNSGSNNNTLTNISSINSGSYAVLNALNNGNIFQNFSITNPTSYGIVAVIDNGTIYRNGTITDSRQEGIYSISSQNLVINDITVENAGTNSFLFSNSTSTTGTGNISINPANATCATVGVNTGSIEVNSSTCP